MQIPHAHALAFTSTHPCAFFRSLARNGVCGCGWVAWVCVGVGVANTHTTHTHIHVHMIHTVTHTTHTHTQTQTHTNTQSLSLSLSLTLSLSLSAHNFPTSHSLSTPAAAGEGADSGPHPTVELIYC